MRRWAWVALLGLLAQLPAQARETWQLATAELPPAITSKRADNGYYAVLVRRVLQELDVDAQLHFLPPDRAIQETMAGRYTAVFPLTRTPERERELIPSEPIFHVRVRVFVRRDDPWSGGGLEAMRGHLLCNIQGARLYPELEAALAAGWLQMQRVPEIGACFRMLALGRVRFVVTGENTGFEGMAAVPDGARKFRMAAEQLALQPVFLMFSRQVKGNVQRAEAFNQALRRLRAEGVMHKLEHQVLPQGPSFRP